MTRRATRGGPETGDMPSIRCTSSFRRTFIRVDAQVQARLALLPPQVTRTRPTRPTRPVMPSLHSV